MSGSVRVTSIDALNELKVSIKRFIGEANGELISLEQELVRKDNYLHDQINHWRHKREKIHEEILEARKDLEYCLDEDNDSCYREEEALEKAEREFRRAETELLGFKEMARELEKVAIDYRKQVRKLKEYMNNDLQRGCLFLDSKFTNLNEFVKIPVPSQRTNGINRSGILQKANSNHLSIAEKKQIMQTLPAPEGLPYSDNMKKYLVGLSYLHNDDFQVMDKYLRSEDHRPAIFKSVGNAEKVLKRDFPELFNREGGWNQSWEGVTLFYTRTTSSINGLPDKPHRTIIAKYGEDVLIHELAHQLHNLTWSETGHAGETKRIKVRELYSNITSGRVTPISRYIDNEGEYFAYSVEWFFQHPAELHSRDPGMFEFLNTEVFEGMYHEN
jgi:hypothetical protein